MNTQSNIPQPPVQPILGNLAQIDGDRPVQSFVKLAREFGPFYRLRIAGRDIYVASSQALVNELSDETRFEKTLSGPLEEVRAFAGDGLFTARSNEPNWAKAHRLLMPAFGPIGVRSMFDLMLDIADQMLTRWDRFGPDTPIDVSDSMTRLTLDTIALCAFDTRFNSFYQNEMHPFVGAMVGGLSEAGNRARRPSVINDLLLSRKHRFEGDQALMKQVAQELIAKRRLDPRGDKKNDLLNVMLNGVDPVTGETLSDENIGYQLVTFLIAGHETTSGLLSFATYLLLKNANVMRKAQEIVDTVLGHEMPRVEHLAELGYIEQILMETLRLWPTAPAFALRAKEDTVLAGKYSLSTEDTVVVLSPTLHRDPAVWGADAESFQPERFSPENAAQLPPNAWKPFGNGARACIGRPFAMQEAQLVLSMMLQRFELSFDDPDYELRVQETLTLKPENLKIRARARHPVARGGQQLVAPETPKALAPSSNAPQAMHDGSATALLVLYGSNSGSCRAFAERIAADAPARGFAPRVAPMDEFAGRLPADGALVIVTASYEGQPPDNARKFVDWLEGLAERDLGDLSYAVFGCGNRQWARTYMAIPKRVDAALEQAGAIRRIARGEADSAGDFFGAFDAWYENFWPSLGEAFGHKVSASAEASSIELEWLPSSREATLQSEALDWGSVVENRELVDMTKPGARSKRHFEISLPESMTYRAGDYLAVIGRNSEENVARALRRFGLSEETQVVVKQAPSGVSGLPIGRPVSLGTLLSDHVELNQPATRSQARSLVEATRCPEERKEFAALAFDRYEAEILGRRVSVLDLVERFQSCDVAFADFLAMSPTMRARQYSISSSPRWKSGNVTLTVAVVDDPALSGQGRFRGIASGFLAGLVPGDMVPVAVRPSNARFHLPEDPAVPIVMAAAGSGVAPFRGFLQERAERKKAGDAVGEALLFFGMDAPDVDYLYQDEFATWQRDGIVTMLPAFSEKSENEIRFVQDRIWAERDRIVEFFEKGAIFYTCGDGKHMAPAVRDTLISIYREVAGVDEATARAWADDMEHVQGRYVADVFA